MIDLAGSLTRDRESQHPVVSKYKRSTFYYTHQALTVTPAGGGMNHIRAAIPTEMDRSFMFAPHLKGGAAGAAADELAETLTTLGLPMDWVIDFGAKTLVAPFDPIKGEDMDRTEGPIARTGAITVFERADAIVADEDFIVNAITAGPDKVRRVSSKKIPRYRDRVQHCECEGRIDTNV